MIATRMKPKPSLSIIDALNDPRLFQPFFDGQSWNMWRAVLKAAHGLKLTEQERKLFETVAEREPPTSPVREQWYVCGRRAGKDSVTSAIATYHAAFFNQQHKLRPGERALVICLAVDREQAKIVLGMIKAYFELPMLKPMVTRETRDGLELSNGVDITVATNDFRAVRGRSILCAILDEVAYFRSDESAAPDTEVYAALKPGLMTLRGTLIGISSPYRRSGLLHQKWKQFYGKDDPNVLVIRAPSIVMNPTLDQGEIDAAIAEDPAKNSAKYLAEWRSDIAGLFTPEAIEDAIIPGRHELPPAQDVHYYAHVDPSGGANDSMTLAIAHREGDSVVLDLVRERKPPFSPQDVVAEFVDVCRDYGIKSVRGDRYAAEWVREQFLLKGMGYKHSELSASELYLELVPLVNSGRAELLEHTKLIAQLGNLERRTSRSGKDTVDHQPGGHDDLANSVAGAIVHAAKRSGVQLAFTSITPGQDTGIREMRVLPDGTPTWSNDAEVAVILRKQPPAKAIQ